MPSILNNLLNPEIPKHHKADNSLGFDFTDLTDIILKMKEYPDDVNAMLLSQLKDEINSFFKDSKCKELVFTQNTDKMFFGIIVMPIVNNPYDIIQGTELVRIKEYYLEIDSKIFSPMLGLSADEIIAILLYQISAMVNDSTPIDTVRKNIDVYLVKNNEQIKISESAHYAYILEFGIKDALRKVTSIFEKSHNEILASSFLIACGYAEELEDAFDKIDQNGYNMNKDCDTSDIIVMSWVIRLYSAVKLRRIVAIKTIKKCLALTASQLEKREMNNLIKCLERIDDSSLLEGFFSDTYSKIKYKNVKSYEDDYFEYAMRVKNVNREDDALSLLHSINVRMNIIDDYLSSEKLSENDQKRWNALYLKFDKLREVLSNKNLYGTDYSRIYITYPTAQEK